VSKEPVSSCPTGLDDPQFLEQVGPIAVQPLQRGLTALVGSSRCPVGVPSLISSGGIGIPALARLPAVSGSSDPTKPSVPTRRRPHAPKVGRNAMMIC